MHNACSSVEKITGKNGKSYGFTQDNRQYIK